MQFFRLGCNQMEARLGTFHAAGSDLGLDAVAFVEFEPDGTCTEPFQWAKGCPITTGMLIVCAFDIDFFAGAKTDFTEVLTGPRNT